MLSCSKFVVEHESSLQNIRQVTKRLFQITESLAKREMNLDPKAYIIRENIPHQDSEVHQKN
jgi:hypothetical protein